SKIASGISLSSILNPLLASHRKDWNRQRRLIGCAQLVQIVTLTEGGARARLRIEIDDCPEQRLGVCVGPEFEPGAATRRNKRVKARRNSRKAVVNRAAELARARREVETDTTFGVVIDEAEQRPERRGKAAQITANRVDDEQRLVAVTTT